VGAVARGLVFETLEERRMTFQEYLGRVAFYLTVAPTSFWNGNIEQSHLALWAKPANSDGRR
jgi:hypothetical protein